MLFILLVALPVALASTASSNSGDGHPKWFTVDVPQVALSVFVNPNATKGFDVVGRILFDTYEVVNGTVVTRIVGRFNKAPSGNVKDYKLLVRHGDSHKATATYIDLGQYQLTPSSSYWTSDPSLRPLYEVVFLLPYNVLSVQDMVGNDYYTVLKYQNRMIHEEIIEVLKVLRTSC